MNRYDACYRAGVKDAIRRYAVWRDGEQLVGVMEKPLQEVLDAVDRDSVALEVEAALQEAGAAGTRRPKGGAE